MEDLTLIKELLGRIVGFVFDVVRTHYLKGSGVGGGVADVFGVLCRNFGIAEEVDESFCLGGLGAGVGQTHL